jgi:hypothetical protein
MIRIAISQAACDAISGALPLGSVGYENEVNEHGERYVWLAPKSSTGCARRAGLAKATAT